MAKAWRVQLALAIGIFGLPAWASAQAGNIAGTVKDATGAVLPGVTVEAASPALIEKARSVITDGSGQYKIVELRPGTYSVTFSLTGFSTVRREGIDLTTGFTAAVHAEMKVGSVAETITVSGQSPVVDIQNTKQQVVLTRDVIDSVPTGKSFQNLGVLIPGIVGGQVVGSTVTQDVGGQSGQNFMTMAIHGGRQTDQRIELDGMSMSAWTRPDSSAVLFMDGNFQEYNINVAANSAESETGGVRINMIPKEGGNVLRGAFFANVGVPQWQANNLSDELRAQGIKDANAMKALWSVNPSIGGPILKDRLWFFGSYTYQRIDTYVANSYLNKDPSAWLFVPDFSQRAVDDQYARDVTGRITWQATAKNKITLYESYNYACHCHFLIGPALAGSPVSSDGSVFLEIPNSVTQGTWTSPITNRLLLEAGGSYVLEDQRFQPRPESVAPRINDTGFNISYRANTSNMGAYTPVYGARGSLSYVTGSHAIKAGFTYVGGYYRNSSRMVGNQAYAALNGNPTSVTYYGTPVVSENNINNAGIFAQDQWTMRQLTVNGGLRLDIFRTGYPDQNVPATQFVQVQRSFPAKKAIGWEDLNPRLGAAYDLFGNGKTALKGSVNRYAIGEGITRSSTINPIASNNTMTRSWTDNGDRLIQGDPFNPATNQELGPSTNLNFGKPVITVAYDEDWAFGRQQRPYNWEFSGSVQQQIVPRVSANLAYFRRIYGNFSVTENRAVSPSDYTGYCVTKPIDPRLPGSGQQLCGLFDLNQNKVGQIQTVGAAASNYGTVTEHWNGVDFTMNARLAKVLLQGGISTGKSVGDNCDLVKNHPNVSLATQAGSPLLASAPATSTELCHVETPFLTQFKMLGSYTLPLDIQVAGTLQTVPGPTITASSTYTSAQIAPSLGRPLSSGTTATIPLIAPGILYSDRLNQLDLRFSKVFRFNTRRIQAMIDLYNVTNNNTVLTQSSTYGTTAGPTAGAAWLVPQVIMPGRVVKFGTQINF